MNIAQYFKKDHIMNYAQTIETLIGSNRVMMLQLTPDSDAANMSIMLRTAATRAGIRITISLAGLITDIRDVRSDDLVMLLTIKGTL